MRFNDVIQSPPDERDFVLLNEAEKLPKEFSLMELMRPVNNQGSEGSCSAQAASCIKETQELVNEGIRTKFSTDYIYFQRENPLSEGMTPRDTMKLLSKGSLPNRYWHSRYKQRIPGYVHELASNFKVSGYARVYDVESLKKAIVDYGACYIAVPVYNSGTRMWYQNPGEELVGGHAMAVIGWDKNGFIIRNSWGEEWGDNGYCVLPFLDFHLIWEVWFVIDDETADIFKKSGRLIKIEKKKFKERAKKFRKSFGKKK